MGFRPAIVAIGSLLLIAGSVVTIAGASEYSITPNPAIDVPNRSFNFEGTDYEVTQIGRVVPGEPISATIDAPRGQDFDVFLYNGDRQIVDRVRDPAGRTVSFEIPAGHPNYRPGTYVVAVEHDGVFQAIAPVVIVGYTISLHVPKSVIVGDRISITADMIVVNNSKSINNVQIVIANRSHEHRTSLASNGNMTYIGTVSVDSLSAGNYSVYVVVQAKEKVFGHNEVLGISEPQSFTIRSSRAATPTNTPVEPSPSVDSSVRGNSTLPGDTATPSPSPGPSLSGQPLSPGTDAPITPIGPSRGSETTRTPGQNMGFIPAIFTLILVLWAGLRHRR